MKNSWKTEGAPGPPNDRQNELGEFGPGELAALISEDERSIQEEGTLDLDEAFIARRKRRRRSTQ